MARIGTQSLEAERYILLAINCCETACFLIKASTSHLRDVKMRSRRVHGKGVYTSLYVVSMYRSALCILPECVCTGVCVYLNLSL